MELVKKKRGRPRKTPLVDTTPVVELPNEIEKIILEVKEKEALEVLEAFEEVKAEVKRAHNGGWDYTIAETPKFFDARYSFELTGYKPIDEIRGLDFDSKKFTEVRDTFMRTGHYCAYPRNTKAYADFWRREYSRCKDGVTIDGYTITGDHYYFLNYYQLMDLQTNKTGEGRNMAFPDFYVALYQWFHYLEMAKRKRKNAVLMKARGVGFSEMDAALAACSYNCRRNANISIVANIDKYVDDTLAKAWNALSFSNDFTDGGMFKLRQVHDTDKWKRASHYKLVNGQKVEEGFMSQIRGTVADKPNKIRGDRTDILLYEELGSWKNSTKAFIQGDALVGIQGAKFGIKIGGGTGGDTGEALEGLRKMYYDPNAYDILPYRHNYTESGEDVLTGFFIPATIIVKNNEYGTFMDNRGYTNPEKGKEYWNMRRATYADKPQDLIVFAAEYCFTAEEAFSLEGDNKFNKVIIAEQLAAIRLHKKAPEVSTGHIMYTYKNNQHTRENINGFMWRPDKLGLVHILEHPIWSDIYKEEHLGEEVYDYSEMNNLYVAGIDGIDIGKEDTSENTDDPSKFCIVIKKRAFGTLEPLYVAYYKDRPNDVREAYKIAMCLAMYYKAPINIEATKIGMTQWAKSKGFFNWFMARPDATYPAGTLVRRKTIGTPATPAIIDHQTDLIAHYIEDSGHMIWFEDMLDELMKYSDENKTHFDIVAALGMVELADEQMGSIIPTKVKKATETWDDVGYYIDERGYKRWGVIPKKTQSNIIINNETLDNGPRTSDPRTWGIG